MGLNVARLLVEGKRKDILLTRRCIGDFLMLFFFTRQDLMARRFVLELSTLAVMSFLFFIRQ
jgi:hypothetical protein